MAKRRSSEPLVKVTLNLFAADYERLGELYQEMDKATVIRLILRNHVQRVTEKVAKATETLAPEIDIELEEISV